MSRGAGGGLFTWHRGISREIKDLEKKRKEMRLSLYQAQDDVDMRKERLIEDIEGRLKQSLTSEMLFTIRRRVV